MDRTAYRVRALRRAGKSYLEISRILDPSLPRPEPKIKRTDTFEKIVALRSEGKSYAKIAAELGVSVGHAFNVFNGRNRKSVGSIARTCLRCSRPFKTQSRFLRSCDACHRFAELNSGALC